jgi:hypothetical protein
LRTDPPELEGRPMAPAQYSLAEFIARKWPALIVIGMTVGIMMADNVVDFL